MIASAFPMTLEFDEQPGCKILQLIFMMILHILLQPHWKKANDRMRARAVALGQEMQTTQIILCRSKREVVTNHQVD